MDKSEILVHVSAPSALADDSRYCAQVEAILNWQSCSREVIPLTTDSVNKPPAAGSPLQQAQIQEQEQEQAQEQAQEQDRKQELQQELQQEPPSSPRVSTVLLISPHTQTPTTTNTSPTPRHNSQNDSLASPVSVIPDSQPQNPDAADESLHDISRDHLFLPLSREHSLTAASPGAPPSSVPSKRCRVHSPPRFDRGALQASSLPSDPDQRHTSPANRDPPTPVASNPSAHLEDEQEAPLQQPKDCLPCLPLEIHPPLPPVSNEQFVTHITPTLAILAKRLNSSRIYNPVKQTRELDKLERGYWYFRINLLHPNASSSSVLAPGLDGSGSRDKADRSHTDIVNDPTHWDISFFSRFWSFLSDFISKDGRAGWGVWCILEDVAPDRGTPSRETGTIPNNPQHVALKVYAWGETACHIYLLLFLASERRIRKMGAQWRDGGDIVIVQMP